MNKSFEMSGLAFKLLLEWFTLEMGIVIGLILIGLGVAADTAILVVWLSRGMGAMYSTHTVFVATTVIVLGIQVVFSSFFLSMFLIETYPEDTGMACDSQQSD